MTLELQNLLQAGDEVLKEAVRNLEKKVYVPASLYRLQMAPGFGFREARSMLSYLRRLGIAAVYMSPYLKCSPGSTHGYNIVDPQTINEELGTEEDYEAFCRSLSEEGLKQVVDVVPNHMGIQGDNRYWKDVLRNGPLSRYASFFDINWNADGDAGEGKVLLPILGKPYGEILEAQEICLRWSDGEFRLRYWDHELPVAPATYPLILAKPGPAMISRFGFPEAVTGELQGILDRLVRVQQSGRTPAEVLRIQEEARCALAEKAAGSAQVRAWLDHCVEIMNGTAGRPASFEALDRLLLGQYYRLAYWRVASEEINYRRFFDINELAAVRVEDPDVFDEIHRFHFRMIRRGLVHGLRIDHPDGLYNPPEYFRRLQACAAAECLLRDHGHSGVSEEDARAFRQRMMRVFRDKDLRGATPFYVIVEKILDRKEKLPDDWSVHGTVGYDVMSATTGVFVDQTSEKAFTECYENYIGHPVHFDDLTYQRKKFFALVHMSSEINNLSRILHQLARRSRYYRDFTRNSLTVAIREMIACFPVYRTYIAPHTQAAHVRDAKYIYIATEKAKSRTPALPHALYDFLRDILLLRLNPERIGGNQRLYRDFILRFQQLTGPVMAKGLEDTAFYVYNRLLSLNEVGGDPTYFGYSAAEFHRLNRERARRWPASMTSTSTHDTKRSKDVRMRLNVLSEFPEEWKNAVGRWAIHNEKHKTMIGGALEPRRNTEYFIYQTLLGVWPSGEEPAESREAFTERIWSCVLKSIREAKSHTNWVNPNTAYEEAVERFVRAVVSPAGAPQFLDDFETFLQRIVPLGLWNSLSAAVLKLGLPGVPDLYQGTELFSFRLVDPDNRVHVDYERRSQLLESLEELSRAADSVIPAPGAACLPPPGEKEELKAYWKGLCFRREHPDLFLKGTYTPLRFTGPVRRNAIAFLRRHGEKTALVATARFFSALTDENGRILPSLQAWNRTRLVLPAELRENTLFTDIISGRKVRSLREGRDSVIRAESLFDSSPVAFLTNMAG